MQLICKSFKIADFEAYVKTLKFNGWTPQFIVVHNTSEPTQELYKSWHDKPNWTMEQWGQNLANYYKGLGWNGTPHCFVGYDKILVLNDLTIHGTHTPSWNKFTWIITNFSASGTTGGLRQSLSLKKSLLIME